MSHKPFLFPQSSRWYGCALTLLLFSTSLFAKTVTLTATDNNTTISLIEGDTLVVTLPSPIADSYKWQLQLGKPSPLTPLQQDIFTPVKDPKGTATQTFNFNAATVGEGLLLFRFERQKTGAAPEVTQSFSVDISVAPGEPKALVLIGFFKGTSVCADCTGIKTELLEGGLRVPALICWPALIPAGQVSNQVAITMDLAVNQFRQLPNRDTHEITLSSMKDDDRQPEPADTADKRQLQMRALARKFSGGLAEPGEKDDNFTELRLLANPL